MDFSVVFAMGPPRSKARAFELFVRLAGAPMFPQNVDADVDVDVDEPGTGTKTGTV